MLSAEKIREMKVFSKQVQMEVVKMIAGLGVGHLGGSLSITDLLSAIAAAAKEVAEIISQRQTWRDRINELEAMEPDQPEAPQE